MKKLMPRLATCIRLSSARLALCALLTLLGLCYSATFAQGLFDDGPKDPFPILRVPATIENLPEKMKAVKSGVLVTLSRKAFEERVRIAAEAQENARTPPRLLEAHYKAYLESTGLRGSARWKVMQSGAGAGILPLQPLNLALEQPRVDSGEAIIGDLDGKSPGLLVERMGEHLVTMNWSVRGETRPEGLQIELEAPTAPIADLELYLPRDQIVSVSTNGCLLTGPHPSDREDSLLWRLNFSRVAQLHLVFHRADEAQVPRPLIQARLISTEQLQPDFLEADFSFDLKVLHRGVRELLVLLDPGLEVASVAYPGMQGYNVLPAQSLVGPALPVPPNILTVQVGDETQGGTLRIGCRGPLPFCTPARSETWMAPGATVEGAVVQGETLLLRISPEVTLDNWQNGHFRLNRSALADDGTTEISLEGGGLEAGPTGRAASKNRPTAKLWPLAVDYRVRQQTLWQLQRPNPSLTSQLTVEMNRGRLQQIPLQLPLDWEVEQVDSVPADLVSHWQVLPQGNASILHLVLKRLLSAPAPGAKSEDAKSAALASARFTVRLRPLPKKDPLATLQTGTLLPFPDLVPLKAHWREGGMAIAHDPTLYEARIVPPPALPLSPPDEDGPWAKQVPEIYLPFRGEPFRGTLTLVPRSLRLRAACSSEVFLTAGQVVVQARVGVKLDVGNLDALEVSLSAPVAGKWTVRDWRSEDGKVQIQRTERLPDPELPAWLSLLGIGSPLEVWGVAACRLAQSASAQRGERWRIRFTQPLSSSHPVELQCELQGPLPADACEIPLPGVEGAGQLDGEVKLFLSGVNVVRVEGDGLHEQSGAASRGVGPIPWRTFRYSSLPVGLTLQGLTSAPDRSAEADADNVSLSTYVGPSGRLLHQFRFQLWSRRWRAMPLGITMPEGATVEGVRIDGRWLDRALLPSAGQRELSLPVAGQTTVHACEVIYSTRTEPCRLWQTLEAPIPELSVRATGCRRTWCLPPGIIPLAEGNLRQLPGPRSDNGPITPFGLPQPAFPLKNSGSDSETVRALGLIEEGTRVISANTREGTVLTLGELLQRLATEFLKDQPASEGVLLVVDAEALTQAALNPRSEAPVDDGRLSLAWMDRLGVALVSSPSAALLTTRRRLRQWDLGGTQASRVPPGLEAAVGEAVRHGQNSTAQFQTVPTWTACQGADAIGGALGQDGLPVGFGDDWTRWEALGPDDGRPSLVIVRSGGVPFAGFVLAVILCLAFGLAGRAAAPLLGKTDRRRSYRLPVLAGWLLLAGLAALWLPPALRGLALWPLLAAIVLALFWYVRQVIVSPPPDAVARSRSTMIAVPGGGIGAATALIALIGAMALLGGVFVRGEEQGSSDTRRPATVFVLPDSSGDPAKQQVLAPQELLTQLDELSRPLPAGLQGAVLLSADYQAAVREDTAVFGATFKAWCFREEREKAELTIPMEGVQIEDEQVLLDGARTSPIAVGRPATAWKFLIRGRGLHTVEVHFSVPIRRDRTEHDLEFRVPPVLQSRLTFAAPPWSRYLSVRGGQAPARGRQAVEQDGICRYAGRLLASGWGTTLGQVAAVPTNFEPIVLRADLGRLNSPLHIRWRQESGKSEPGACEVSQASLWTFRTGSSGLTALVQCHQKKDSGIAGMDFDLPTGLEVENIDASALPDRAPVRLRDWRVPTIEGKRRLEVRFTRPPLGDFEIELRLLRSQPAGIIVDLSVPVPVEGPPFRVLESLLAYRLDGLETRKPIELRHWSRIENARFQQRWSESGKSWPGGGDVREAFILRPVGDDPSVARLQLQQAQPEMKASQELSWRIGPQFADLKAVCKIHPGPDDVALVEWEVPPAVQITHVTGRQVQGWTRSGSRLQVWLEQPHEDKSQRGEIVLAGWEKIDLVHGTPFTLPPIRLLGSLAQDTTVHVTPAPGIILEQQGAGPAGIVPRPGHAELEVRYRQTPPRAVFAVRRLGEVDVRTMTLAEVKGSQLQLTAVVECQAHQGELRSLRAQLRHWPGDEVHLEAAQLIGRTEPKREGGNLALALELQPGVTGKYRFALTATLSLDRLAAGFVMPEVTVDEAAPERSQAWMAVDSTLVVKEQRGLTSVVPREIVSAWAMEKARLQNGKFSFYRAIERDWSLTLSQRSVSSPARALQVLLSDHVATILDGQRWTHQATYWVYHEANTDLSFSLPAGASVLAVAVDGVEVTPLEPSADRLWVPLAGGPGCLRIDVRWQTLSGGESPERPDSACPTLEGAKNGPVLWTVYVPAGFGVADRENAAGQKAHPIAAAERLLVRARAQFRIAALVAPQVHGPDAAAANQFLAAEQRFFRLCGSIECELAQPASAGNLSDDDRQRLSDQLQSLKDENTALSRAPTLENLRDRAQRAEPEPTLEAPEFPTDGTSASDGEGLQLPPLRPRGAPQTWEADSSAGLPVIRFVAAAEHRRRQAELWTLLLLAFLGCALVAWRFPAVQRWLHHTWPEQLLLLGLAAWLAWGIAWPVLLFVPAGIFARAFLLLRALAARRLQDAPAEPPPPSSAVSIGSSAS
jgi:hypothetical protein